MRKFFTILASYCSTHPQYLNMPQRSTRPVLAVCSWHRLLFLCNLMSVRKYRSVLPNRNTGNHSHKSICLHVASFMKAFLKRLNRPSLNNTNDLGTNCFSKNVEHRQKCIKYRSQTNRELCHSLSLRAYRAFEKQVLQFVRPARCRSGCLHTMPKIRNVKQDMFLCNKSCFNSRLPWLF